MRHSKKAILTLSCAALLSVGTYADHQWSNYHWATEDGVVHLPSVDQVTSDWQASYEESLDRWEQSNSIDHNASLREQGDESSRARKRCNAQQGKMVTCNASYGFNGWAGLASINLDSNGHITQGTAKMNDSYLSNDPTHYRNHVMCQEIGHVYGLGHTSEDGSSQKTCMDYSNDPDSQWPNNHDYQLLSEMYSHTDGYTTVADGGGTTEPPCRGGPKKCGNRNGAVPAPRVKIKENGRSQIWVSPGENNSIWVHHITLAEGHSDIIHDDHH